jgi:DNA-binding MarR family transcriptional regulator
MSVTRTAPPPPLFGQLLGQAHGASTALLEDLLAQHETSFDRWVILNLLAQRDPATDRDQFWAELARAFQNDEEAVERPLTQLEAGGLITVARDNGSVSVAMTPSGLAQYAELRASIGNLSAQLLGDVDPDDLAAARRVLEHMRARAEMLQR